MTVAACQSDPRRSTWSSRPPSSSRWNVPLPSDMKVHVPSRDGFVYPDVSIVYGAPRFYDETEDVLTNPSVVFEVLSESTERFDRGEKFVGYRTVPSLRELVLVSQHEMRVEHYVKQPDGAWILREHAGEGEVALDVEGRISLAEIYANTGVETQV